MPRKAPITRKKFSGTISILLEQRLRTLAKNTGRQMSALLDEAVRELLERYSREGGVTMIDELEKTQTTHVLCISNYKGGVGKTTTATELAYLMAKKGKKQVLIIDADGQSNITTRMGCEPNQENSIDVCLRSSMERGPLQVEPFISTTQYKGIDIISGSSAIGQDFFRDTLSAYRSRTGKNPYQKIVDAVKALNRYDIIIIDTHPSADNEIRFPMQASTDVLCPIYPDMTSFRGALATYEQINDSREATPNLRFLGVFLNKVDMRTSQGKDFIPSVRESFPEEIRNLNNGQDDGCVFDTYVRYSADAGKADVLDCSICARFHGGMGAKDFEKLYNEVVTRLG